MKLIFLLFFTTLITMVILDVVWLMLMAKQFFVVHIGHLMSAKPKLIPIVLFYLIYSFAITVFVVLPSVNHHYDTFLVFLLGALFGLAAYGTYDFTNHALMKNWPVIVTVVDLAWGSFLTGVTSVIGVWLAREFNW